MVDTSLKKDKRKRDQDNNPTRDAPRKSTREKYAVRVPGVLVREHPEQKYRANEDPWPPDVRETVLATREDIARSAIEGWFNSGWKSEWVRTVGIPEEPVTKCILVLCKVQSCSSFSPSSIELTSEAIFHCHRTAAVECTNSTIHFLKQAI